MGHTVKWKSKPFKRNQKKDLCDLGSQILREELWNMTPKPWFIEQIDKLNLIKLKYFILSHMQNNETKLHFVPIYKN